MTRPTRREVTVSGGVFAAAVALTATSTHATTDELLATLKEVAKGAAVTPGRVKLTMPELAENGNVVSALIEVQSP